MSKTKNTLRLSVARVVGVIVQLVSIPLVWDTLGGDVFGACYFLMAIGRWVSLIDIGYNEGSQRLITRAFDSDDKKTGFSVYQQHALILIVHALIGAFVFASLSTFIDIPEVADRVNLRTFFAVGGIVFAAQYLYQNGFVYFNATRQFKFIAVANGFQFIVSGLLALGLTLWFKRPEAYLAGFATGFGLVYLYSLVRGLNQARTVEGKYWFNKESFKYCFGFGIKLYLTKVGSVAIGTFDRVLLTNMMGPASLTQYANATRYSEIAGEALPLNQTLLPDLTKAHMEGKQKFAELADRGSRIALMVGCGMILIPCSFGGPVLQIWLQDKYVPEMAIVMLCMGAFRAFEAFFGSLVQAMFAHGSPLGVTLLTTITAVLLVFLAYPAILFGGLAGVAIIRVLVHAALFLPVAWLVWKYVLPEITFAPWIKKLAGTLGIAALFSTGGFWLSQLPFAKSMPWIPILILPFVMFVFFFLIDRLGLAPVPETVKRGLRKLIGKEDAAA